MDFNRLSFWMDNTERIKREIKFNKTNIKGINKKECLEYADLENQHYEQKSEKVTVYKIFHGFLSSGEHVQSSKGGLLNHVNSFGKSLGKSSVSGQTRL